MNVRPTLHFYLQYCVLMAYNCIHKIIDIYLNVTIFIIYLFNIINNADKNFVFRNCSHTNVYFIYIVLIALSRCNRVFTRRLRLCHSHTVRRREVRKGDREGLNRVVSEQ